MRRWQIAKEAALGLVRTAVERGINSPPKFLEIGVCVGELAAKALSEFPDLLYTGIDPWRLDDTYQAQIAEKTRRCLLSEASWESVYELAKAAVAFAGDRARLVRSTSIDAAPQFPDGYFDIVYIDGDHSYKAVTEDLEAYWPKVSPGGIFAGDDFCHKFYKLNVCRAVSQWFAARNMQFEIIGEQVWWVRKP